MLKMEKEKAYASVISFDLKPPYPTDCNKALSNGLCDSIIQKLNSGRGNTRERVVCFLASRGAHSCNLILCLREFLESLTDCTCTWYVNLKLGSMHSWEHIVSLFKTKLFCAEAKFTPAELGKTC